MQKTPRFKVRQRFKTGGKNPRVCTIVDILRTVNLAGECVKLRSVATHAFCGLTTYEEYTTTGHLKSRPSDSATLRKRAFTPRQLARKTTFPNAAQRNHRQAPT